MIDFPEYIVSGIPPISRDCGLVFETLQLPLKKRRYHRLLVCSLHDQVGIQPSLLALNIHNNITHHDHHVRFLHEAELSDTIGGWSATSAAPV